MSQQQQSAINESLILPDFSDEDDVAGDQDDLSVPKPPWWRRRGGIIIIISVILLIVLLGGLVLAVQLTRRQARVFQTAKVIQGNLTLIVSATGPLQGGTYNVDFSGTGIISELDVKMGQTVTKGQVLAKLDKTSLQDAVNQAQAAVMAAITTVNNNGSSSSATQGQSTANIAAAQTTLSNAQTNLAKVQDQSQVSITAAQTTLDNAITNYHKVQAQSSANVRVAFIQMQQACNPTPTPTPAPTSTPAPSPTPTGGSSCKVATAQYHQAVANANAANATAKGQVNTAEQQLNTAEAMASANNATAQGQVNTAQSQLNTAMSTAGLSNTNAQGMVNTAQSQLQTALAQLQTAEHNLNNATLTAPHAGFVTTVNGTVGGTPGGGIAGSTAPTGTTFIQIVDPSVLQVVANVNESDTANLKVGESAQFTVSAYGERKFNGTVSAITPNGLTVSNVVTYPVTIDVDMNDLRGANLLPGMTGNVTIIVTQRSKVLLIPVSAVSFARLASNPNTTSGTPLLISKDDANVALDQARQMLIQLQNQHPDIGQDNPMPAFVLERSGNQFNAKPVVVGLTDGVVYEVLSGMSPGEIIVTGVQPGG